MTSTSNNNNANWMFRNIGYLFANKIRIPELRNGETCVSTQKNEGQLSEVEEGTLYISTENIMYSPKDHSKSITRKIPNDLSAQLIPEKTRDSWNESTQPPFETELIYSARFDDQTFLILNSHKRQEKGGQLERTVRNYLAIRIEKGKLSFVNTQCTYNNLPPQIIKLEVRGPSQAALQIDATKTTSDILYDDIVKNTFKSNPTYVPPKKIVEWNLDFT